MANRMAVDSSSIIALFRGDTAVAIHLDNAEEILLPTPVLAELIYGALCSVQPDVSLIQVRDLRARCVLIPCDEVVAEQCARIRLDLRLKGRPIPANDTWIAACALIHNVPLLTADPHFTFVEGLSFVV